MKGLMTQKGLQNLIIVADNLRITNRGIELAGSWKDEAGPDEILKTIRQGMESIESREDIR